jgi:hypothetical protein
MRLGYEYVVAYEKGAFNLKMLSTLKSVRLAVVVVYQSAVAHKIMVPIEDLEPEIKRQLWDLCKPFVTETMPMEDRRNIARAYWCLDQLAALKESGVLKF